MTDRGKSAHGPNAISVVIIAQDDESRITGAIASCRPFADEIVVVDGGSKDGTVRVAELLGCRVCVNAWPGYAKQRNYGSRLAAHDWIFVIDTDEAVTERLAQSILRLKPALADAQAAYAVFRVGDFLGKWMESGEFLVRLYNRKAYRFKETLVHETPDVPERHVSKLEGTLLHYGFRSVHDHVRRFNRYTDLEAEAALAAGKRFSLARLLLRPPLRFAHKYVAQGLFRKGIPGLAVAVFWAQYEFLVGLKRYEADRVRARAQPLPQQPAAAGPPEAADDKAAAGRGEQAGTGVKEGKAYAVR